MSIHLGDLSAAPEYRVRIEFTPAFEPSQFFEGLPYVSLLTEIEANSLSPRAAELRKEHGRIPYGAPLYWWESHGTSGNVVCEYIGQTIRQSLQKRFEAHAKVSRLLAKYVNDPEHRIMFRLCSRLDVSFGNNCHAIEHLPPEQAAKVVIDVEARLIFERQPPFNTHHKRKPKIPWKPFVIEAFHFGWPPFE
jgi:hypothetical protein